MQRLIIIPVILGIAGGIFFTHPPAAEAASQVVVPISGFFTRVTKKPFGTYITPKTSPVQPEVFRGYHTGVDAETTSAEQKKNIPVIAIAAGRVVAARYVTGYGGVILIQHTVQGQTITALYGHLRQSSFKVRVGTIVKAGTQIAVLGTGYRHETSGERRHLHLGIIRGAHLNYTGYVSSKRALAPWEDPVAWLKAHGAK